MTTKKELQDDLIIYFRSKLNELSSELNYETSPLLKSSINPSNPDYEYSCDEFQHLLNNHTILKNILHSLIDTTINL